MQTRRTVQVSFILSRSACEGRKSSSLPCRYAVMHRSLFVTLTWETQNLDSFSDDLYKQVRVAMERYIDTMHGTGATIAQSTEVARHAIQAINLDHDSGSPCISIGDDGANTGSGTLEEQDRRDSRHAQDRACAIPQLLCTSRDEAEITS